LAPYGDDITESIPYSLSNPAGATTYSTTGEAYDVAFAGLPFFINSSDDSPYRRVTAQYRKQQYDQTREAGEQSLTGWWFRSQSSFHLGAGAKFFEPSQDESLRFQFTKSKGVDIWTKGQVTLLNDTENFYTGSTGTTYDTQLVGVNDGTDDCILVSDASALKKITDGGTSSTYTQTGTASQIFSVTTDGKRYFFVNTTKVHRGNVAGTTSDTEIYNIGSTATRAIIRYVKQRLICAIGSSLYELNPNAGSSTALPTALYTHPNPNWVWSAIAEGPQAIYVAGYDPSGSSSSVYKITLDATTPNSLGFPTLNVPTVVIDMPENESIYDFDVYLGSYALLATSKGARVGVSDTNGDITYGPLLYKDSPSYGVAFRDTYAFVTTEIDGEAGLARIDLATTIYSGLLFFPYTWDLTASGTTTTALQVAFFGTSDTLAFTVGNNVWAEDNTTKVSTGYLQTGFIRYNTLEAKIFKFILPQFDTTYGSLEVDSIDSDGTEYGLGIFSQGDSVGEITAAYPPTAQQYLAFKFTFNVGNDTSKSPIFTGYQVKALPAVPRQRLIQYPVLCFDHEMDKFGVSVGYEGSAWSRMQQLEAVENVGDTIRVQDFRTGESYIGLIEEIDFTNKTPTDKRFSGFGGVLLVTIRSV
jgi:hypothetical protein